MHLRKRARTSAAAAIGLALIVAACSAGATTAPATQAPATQAPATQAPATQAPATQAPATQAPATQAPASAAPVDAVAVALELTRKATRGEAADFQGSSGKTIGVLVPWFDNDGFQAIYVGIASEAIKADVSMLTLNSNRSPETALAQVQDLVSKKVDAIVIDPFDAAALSAAVKAANAAGIPVVAFDQPPVSGELAGLVASDNKAHGAASAEIMAGAATSAGLDPKGLKVLELLGDQASQSGQDRHAGFESVAKAKGFDIVASLPTNWDDTKANGAVLDAFQANPDIQAVFMPSGCAMYNGVSSALQSLGKWFPIGDPKHIIVTSVDGCPQPVTAVKDKYLDGDAAQQLFVMGQKAMSIAVAIVNGTSPAETKILLPPDPITPDNWNDPKHWVNVLGLVK